MKFTIINILFDNARDFSYRNENNFYAEKNIKW